MKAKTAIEKLNKKSLVTCKKQKIRVLQVTAFLVLLYEDGKMRVRIPEGNPQSVQISYTDLNRQLLGCLFRTFDYVKSGIRNAVG